MKEIPLTRGQFALVDDDDYDYLMQWKWFALMDYRKRDMFYAGRRDYSEGGSGKTIQMHRVIMNTPTGLVVDHIDHNGLNNQKSNLRNCTHKENIHNTSSKRNTTSKYLGVCYIKKKSRNGKKYYTYIKASIHVGNLRLYLGQFKTEEEAACAYDKAARRYYGEFANLNFPDQK